MEEFYVTGWTHSFLWVLILGFIVAFFLAFAMGANDCANSYGPAVGSGVLTLYKAYICATVFEVLGAALLGYKVTNTVREGIVNVAIYDVSVIEWPNKTYSTVKFCDPFYDQPPCRTYTRAEFMLGALATLIGCATFMIAATIAKMPVSTTHSIIGATVGFSLVLMGTTGIHWAVIAQIVASWVASPILAGLFSTLFYSLFKFFAFNKPYPLESSLKTLPVVFWLTVFVNVFAAMIGGSKYLRLHLIPWWVDIIIASVFATVAAIIVWTIGTEHISRKIKDSIADELEASHITKEKSSTSTGSSLSDETRLGQLLNGCTPFYSKGSLHERMWDVWRPCPEPIEGSMVFASLQILSSCFLSFTHGSNDTANAVGPLVALWISYSTGYALGEGTPGSAEGLIVFGAASMIIGLWCLGHKVIKTVGSEISSITPASGFCIQMGTAVSVLLASHVGIPVSTTHCVIGAIVILGYFRSRASVKWRLFGNIAIAWVVTLPAAGLVAALFTYLLSFAV